jgi:hypothetical protein
LIDSLLNNWWKIVLLKGGSKCFSLSSFFCRKFTLEKATDKNGNEINVFGKMLQGNYVFHLLHHSISFFKNEIISGVHLNLSLLWLLMAITRSDELRHSPAARDGKSTSRVIAIIICSLNNTLLFCLFHSQAG